MFGACLVPKKVLDLFFLQAFILFYFIFALKSLLFSEKISFRLTILFMTFDDKHFFFDTYSTYYM